MAYDPRPWTHQPPPSPSRSPASGDLGPPAPALLGEQVREFAGRELGDSGEWLAPTPGAVLQGWAGQQVEFPPPDWDAEALERLALEELGAEPKEDQ